MKPPAVLGACGHDQEPVWHDLAATRMARCRLDAGSVPNLQVPCRAIEADPAVRYVLWQRGLSLYYAGSYTEAVQQFKDDVARNPNDTEEAIWAFLSEAQVSGPSAARANFLQVWGRQYY